MDSEYILTSDGELIHWGIKGMRWGVRRYQTKDGSLTPAGKKRYDKDMAKVKAETKRLKNQQATDKKLNKLEEAKKNLAALKGKKSKTDDSSVETDDQKRDRILKNPSAKDVYENRHLFSNREIQELSLRLNNENTIKNLIPKEVDAGKAKVDDLMNKVGDMTSKAVTAAKAYNMVANIYNAFSKSDLSLPKIDTDITKGNKETRRQEKKRRKEEQEKKKQEAKEAKEAKEKEAAEKKRKKDMDAYEEYNRQYTDPPKSGTSTYTDTSYRSTGGERTYTDNSRSRELSVASSNSKGRAYTDSYSNWETSYKSIADGSSASRGKRATTSLLDKNGDVIVDDLDNMDYND